MKRVDALGHVGYGLYGAGNLLIANQNALGYIFVLVAASLWTGIGLKIGMTSVWIWEILCIGTAVYGYWNWTHQS